MSILSRDLTSEQALAVARETASDEGRCSACGNSIEWYRRDKGAIWCWSCVAATEGR